jgi:protocatechuate 3,4-dioxygenase, alpha subunit
MNKVPTSSQTIGPFFSIGLERLCDAALPGDAVRGERIVVEGAVVDGDGLAVPDALLEIWQADADGKYDCGEPTGRTTEERRFRGFARLATDERGRFQFATVKPGRVAHGEDAEMAPHLLVSIFMRGLLTRLVTRIYFGDETKNATDPILRLVPEERRGTLIAHASAAAPARFKWNVKLQGPDETVFFAC